MQQLNYKWFGKYSVEAYAAVLLIPLTSFTDEPPPIFLFFLAHSLSCSNHDYQNNSTVGFSLHIQRSDGRDGDLPIADISSVISLFESIPWKDEVAQWETLPEEERELRRPLLQVFDDSGHTLHVMAYSDELIGVAYNYPAASSPFGVNYEEEEGYIGTDQYPRNKFQTLLECFFASDTQSMLAHLEAFTVSDNE